MSLLSTHLAADQETIASGSSVFYQKPANFYTKRDAALLNSRVLSKKDAQLHFLTEWPTTTAAQDLAYHPRRSSGCGSHCVLAVD